MRSSSVSWWVMQFGRTDSSVCLNHHRLAPVLSTGTTSNAAKFIDNEFAKHTQSHGTFANFKRRILNYYPV